MLSILLYGWETWTMSKQLEKPLDDTYTRLLMRVQKINWKPHFTLQKIYGNLSKVSDVVRMRRNCFTGHCLRAKEDIMSHLLFWSLAHQKREWKWLSYPETLVRDNDTDILDLVNIMENTNLCKRPVDSHLGHGHSSNFPISGYYFFNLKNLKHIFFPPTLLKGVKSSKFSKNRRFRFFQ